MGQDCGIGREWFVMNPLFLFRKEMTPIRKLLMLHLASGGKLIEQTATGNPLTFVTDVAKPLSSLLIPFTPVQSGTGDPSPENIRPISGWTGVNVWHYPENKLNITNTSGTISQGITFTPIKDSNNVVRSVHVEGTKSGSNVFYNFNYAVGTLSFPVGSYKVSGYSSICAFRVYAITNGSESKIFDSQNQTGFTVTSDMTQVWMRIQVMGDVGQTVNETVYPIVIASDATLSSYPVVFPDSVGTVYGGTLDLTTGVLTATHYGVLADGTEQGWTYSVSQGLNRFVIPPMAWGKAAMNNGNIYLSYIKSSTRAETWCGWVGGTGNILVYGSTEIDTKQKWIDYLAENNLQIVYELAEPYTIQLSPVQITALLGDNVIWSDTNGTNTAVYLKKG